MTDAFSQGFLRDADGALVVTGPNGVAIGGGSGGTTYTPVPIVDADLNSFASPGTIDGTAGWRVQAGGALTLTRTGDRVFLDGPLEYWGPLAFTEWDTQPAPVTSIMDAGVVPVDWMPAEGGGALYFQAFSPTPDGAIQGVLFWVLTLSTITGELTLHAQHVLGAVGAPDWSGTVGAEADSPGGFCEIIISTSWNVA